MRAELLSEAEGVAQPELDRRLVEHRGRFARGETQVMVGPGLPSRCVTVDCPHAARWRVWGAFPPNVPLDPVYWCDLHLEARRTRQGDLFGEGAA